MLQCYTLSWYMWLYMFMWLFLSFFFFCKQKTAYEMRISDWSSDVCSSDLRLQDQRGQARRHAHVHGRKKKHELTKADGQAVKNYGAPGQQGAPDKEDGGKGHEYETQGAQ